MKKTTGILMLLAVAGGCSSFQAGPDLGDRSNYSARVTTPPGPAATTWLENDRMKAYQYAGGTSANRAMVAATPRPTAVCAAMAPPAPTPAPVDSGILPPPAPVSSTSPPAALAAATPPVAEPVQQVGYPAPGKTLPNLGSLPGPDAAAPCVTEAPTVKPAGILPAPGEVVSAQSDPGPSPVEQTTVSAKTPLLLDTQPSLPTPPSVRLVNSKRITINYEIKGVGPSGVSGVELWYTQDGKTWKKRDVSSQAKPPYVIEVADEGLYGFTLLARNGIGLAKEPPKAGDLPQIWVEVDKTKPVVQLTGIHANCTNTTQNVVVRWKASDKNFGPRPIVISYSESATGPWRIMAANVPNTGRYEWPLPPEAPARFHVKVEASDLVGNIGIAQTPKPVLMDRAQPTVSILTVEGGK